MNDLVIISLPLIHQLLFQKYNHLQYETTPTIPPAILHRNHPTRPKRRFYLDETTLC